MLGLEGMVKLKNLDEIVVVASNNGNPNANSIANAENGTSFVHNSESQAELNASTVSNADSEKRWLLRYTPSHSIPILLNCSFVIDRSSTAAHRSLPDIPVAENNDNGSELYETVAEKQLVSAHNQSRKYRPTPHFEDLR